MELLNQYQDELSKDTRIDELNLTDVAYKLPAIKHKWAARLINAKIKVSSLDREKNSLQEKIINKLSEETNTRLAKFNIDKSLSASEEYNKLIKNIDSNIEEYKMIVLYLEKVENIFKNMTFDIKNIIDLNKLETT